MRITSQEHGKSFLDNNDVTVIGRIESGLIKCAPDGCGICYRGMIGIPRKTGFIDTFPIIITEKIYKEIVRDNLDRDILLSGTFKSCMKTINCKPVNHQYIFANYAETNTDFYENGFNNVIHLSGTICKPLKPRDLPLSKVYYYAVAVNRGKETDYIPCTAKSDVCELDLSTLKVGDRIELEGRLVAREHHIAETREKRISRECRVGEILSIDYK